MSTLNKLAKEIKEYPYDLDAVVEQLGGKIIYNRIVDKSRWYYHRKYFIAIGDEYFTITTTQPATENQEPDDTFTIRRVDAKEKRVLVPVHNPDYTEIGEVRA